MSLQNKFKTIWSQRISKYDKWINVTSKSIKKLKPANFAVFYIGAISNNIDSHKVGTLGVIGLFTADRLSAYRLFTEINIIMYNIFSIYIFICI